VSKLKNTFPLENAKVVAFQIMEDLSDFVERVEVCGSVRRKKELVGDVDIVIIPKDGCMSRLAEMNAHVTEQKARIDTAIPVEIYFTTEDEWGAALMHHTGSKELNIRQRVVAKSKGYTLSQHGLFEGGVMIAGKTERELYDKLGLNWRDPEER